MLVVWCEVEYAQDGEDENSATSFWLCKFVTWDEGNKGRMVLGRRLLCCAEEGAPLQTCLRCR